MNKATKIILSILGLAITIIIIIALYKVYAYMYILLERHWSLDGSIKTNLKVILSSSDYVLFNLATIGSYIFHLIAIWGIKENKEEEK